MRLEIVPSEHVQKCCTLNGVRVAETRDGPYALGSITLMDDAGHIMVIEGGDYNNSIRVLGKAPPKKQKVYRLVGEMFTGSIGLEVKIDETFDDRSQATARKTALEQHGGSFTITETEVEVPDNE